MNFTQFNKNGGVEGFCLIKTVDRKMTAKGVPYLDLTLADPDGEINAKALGLQRGAPRRIRRKRSDKKSPRNGSAVQRLAAAEDRAHTQR